MGNYRVTLKTPDGRISHVHIDYLEGAIRILKNAQHIGKCRGISGTLSIYSIHEHGETLVQEEVIA